MRNTLLAGSIAALLTSFAALAPASAQECNLEGVELNCGNGAKYSVQVFYIMNSFSAVQYFLLKKILKMKELCFL